MTVLRLATRAGSILTAVFLSYGHKARVDDSPAAIAKVDESVDCLKELLDQGQVFYGKKLPFSTACP